MRAHFAACLVATVGVCLLLAHFTIGAPRPITILRASPLLAMAPADLAVEIHVTPDATNRFASVRCDGPDFARSSEWSLDGAQAQTLFRVVWRELPQGEYDVTAVVRSATHERGRTRVRVERH